MPPKYPVKAPRRMPAQPEKSTTRLPMPMVVPSPFMTLEKMSRPKLSVPKMWRRDGALNVSAADMAVVLYGVQNSPTMPRTTARPVIAKPARKYLFHGILSFHGISLLCGTLFFHFAPERFSSMERSPSIALLLAASPYSHPDFKRLWISNICPRLLLLP